MTDIIKYADLRTQLSDLRKNGPPRGPDMGLDCLTDLYRSAKGYFTSVTGIPNHGKSTFLDWMRISLSMMYGWKHATFSPENYPLAMYYNRLVETYCGTTQENIPADIYQDGVQFIDEHFHFCYPDENNCTVDGLLEIFSRCHENFGCDTVLVDPFNELEHRRPASWSETEYTSNALTKFRRFCRERDVHGWIVVHPTKLQRDTKTGEYPVPTPWDCHGSAHWRNKPDFCLCVHRPDMTASYCQVHVQKMRYRNFGKLGMVELEFDWSSGRYAPRGSRNFLVPRRAE